MSITTHDCDWDDVERRRLAEAVIETESVVGLGAVALSQDRPTESKAQRKSKQEHQPRTGSRRTAYEKDRSHC